MSNDDDVAATAEVAATTPKEHYRKASHLIALARSQMHRNPELAAMNLTAAQVHATLASVARAGTAAWVQEQ